MRILRFALRWGAPPLLALGFFALGYAVFFPGLASSKLSDGSVSSFNETANRISKGNLLENASPLERVAWLLARKQRSALPILHRYLLNARTTPGERASILDLCDKYDPKLASWWREHIPVALRVKP